MTTAALETPRLRLVPFAEQHLSDEYVGWLNDPAVVRYSDQRFRTHTLDSCREYWRSFAGTPHHFWAITRREAPGAHIGNVTAYVDTHHATVDVGILVSPRAQGTGFATEAWLAACDHLLRVQGLRKLTAGTLETNVAMLGVMRRAGMTDELRRVRQCQWEGREVDIVGARLFREEWVARHPRGPFAAP